MLIKTSRFGNLELDESTVIHFPWGIPGFEDIKRYVLLEHRTGPFQWMQAVDQEDLAFVVCEPHAMGGHYRIPAEKTKPIGIEHVNDLIVLIMVSFDRENKKIIPHWRGPLLFNAASRIAYQLSIDSRELNKYLTF